MSNTYTHNTARMCVRWACTDKIPKMGFVWQRAMSKRMRTRRTTTIHWNICQLNALSGESIFVSFVTVVGSVPYAMHILNLRRILFGWILPIHTNADNRLRIAPRWQSLRNIRTRSPSNRGVYAIALMYRNVPGLGLFTYCRTATATAAVAVDIINIES